MRYPTTCRRGLIGPAVLGWGVLALAAAVHAAGLSTVRAADPAPVTPPPLTNGLAVLPQTTNGPAAIPLATNDAFAGGRPAAVAATDRSTDAPAIGVPAPGDGRAPLSHQGTTGPATIVSGTNGPATSPAPPKAESPVAPVARMPLANGPSVNGPVSGGRNANGRYSSGRSAGSASLTASKPSTGRRDFSDFRIITERNIFDPNRRSRSVRPVTEQPKPVKVDSFSLVGTMSYEKGDFAFFDGSSSEFRKALRAGDSVAGHKVREIGSKSVKLETGGQVLELAVGAQMRRQDGGPWQMSARTDSYASASTSGSSGGGSGSNAGESDLLKRLMQQRQREIR